MMLKGDVGGDDNKSGKTREELESRGHACWFGDLESDNPVVG